VRASLRGVGVLLGIVLGLVALSMFFSEWGEVVVIRPLGVESPSETRVWIVELPDGAYLRGGHGPGWAESAVMAGRASLRRDGSWQDYRVFDVPGARARDRVNAAMAAKYGFSDRFIGWTRDVESTRPLRLEPMP
jgi:hypothetical protein